MDGESNEIENTRELRHGHGWDTAPGMVPRAVAAGVRRGESEKKIYYN